MPLFSHMPSSAVKIAFVDRWVPTLVLTYPPCHTPADSNPTLEYGPLRCRTGRTGPG